MDQLVLGDYPRALDEQGLKDCAALLTSPVVWRRAIRSASNRAAELAIRSGFPGGHFNR
jgi:hypothetical protein